MKMIASTKLAKAQRAMQAGKEYGAANAEIFQHSSPESSPSRQLFIVISSDKGLCGGIHSSVTKATRRQFTEGSAPAPQDSPIMVVGDKSKAQLSRFFPKNLALTFNQVGRDVPTFADAAAIADLVSNSGVKYDVVNIVYNKFVSAISYESAQVQVLNGEGLKDAREYSLFPVTKKNTKKNLK